MPLHIKKSIQNGLSKIKFSKKKFHLSFSLPTCKHSKTTSFRLTGVNDSSRHTGGYDPDKDKQLEEQHSQENAVTLSDIDRFLFENFRSLYQKEYEEQLSNPNNAKLAAYLFESRRLLDLPPARNHRRAATTARLLARSQSSSSVITNDGCSSDSSADEQEEILAAKEVPAPSPDDLVAVLTYAPSPYEKFRRSMQEMVEARVEHNGKVDWDFMEELLFSYFDLNNKKSYKFILRAFVDLIVVLRENSGRIPASRRRLKAVKM